MRAAPHGPLVYQTYRFWYRAVPRALEQAVSQNRGMFFPGSGYDRNYLGWAMAIDDCGSTRSRTDQAIQDHAAAKRASPAVQPSAMAFPATEPERKAQVNAASASRLAPPTSAPAPERRCISNVFANAWGQPPRRIRRHRQHRKRWKPSNAMRHRNALSDQAA